MYVGSISEKIKKMLQKHDKDDKDAEQCLLRSNDDPVRYREKSCIECGGKTKKVHLQ